MRDQAATGFLTDVQIVSVSSGTIERTSMISASMPSAFAAASHT